MDFKLPFTLLAIGVVVAGIIPFGMSQVNESAFMEIDMLPTQTQNPFSIQDEFNEEVFCINPEGYIECGGAHVTELVYVGEPVFAFSNQWSDLPSDNTFDHDSVLAFWTVDYGSVTSQPFIMINDAYLYAEAQRLSGASTCGVAVEYWNSGEGWNEINGLFSDFTSGATWTALGDITSENFDNDHEAYRVIVYTGASTSCEIRNINTFLPVFEHSQMTITRVK